MNVICSEVPSPMSRKPIIIKKLRLGSLLSPRTAPESSSGGSSSSSSSRSTSSSSREETPPAASVSERSRSAPVTLRDVPQCPVCRDDSGNFVRKLRYWMGGNTWVWHCSAESAGRDGSGTSFCGAIFSEDRPRAVCKDCGGMVRLLMVGGEAQSDFYYHCSRCKLKE